MCKIYLLQKCFVLGRKIAKGLKATTIVQVAKMKSKGVQSVIKMFLEIAGYRDTWNHVLQNKTKL